ncbi:hypothetical protein H5410_011066 [Solanum commersonii]|uniref:Uncharacterized protein n=1 Tax=Solanum commersonii TaxID=4109 RepID=A0A9J6AMH1_SOLCO|nr:hypothetical protein H5410_011066 [Solanum commersonii]
MVLCDDAKKMELFIRGFHAFDAHIENLTKSESCIAVTIRGMTLPTRFFPYSGLEPKTYD